jgi:hypothetical protein
MKLSLTKSTSIGDKAGGSFDELGMTEEGANIDRPVARHRTMPIGVGDASVPRPDSGGGNERGSRTP